MDNNCVILVISVKLSAISPNKLGQIMPTELHPHITPINIPIIFIPTGVIGEIAGNKPNPNTNKQTIAELTYQDTFLFFATLADIFLPPKLLNTFKLQLSLRQSALPVETLRKQTA